MPIYEYACDECGETLEVIHSLSATPPETHEGCGGRLQRVMSAPATRVKETGEPGTTHTSMLRFQENQRIAADVRKRKKR
jgi:putative FmdB family regulatory protein